MSESQSPSVKEILEALLPAIHFVDQECPVCQGEFCKDANYALEHLGLPYRYRRRTGDNLKVDELDIELVEVGEEA